MRAKKNTTWGQPMTGPTSAKWKGFIKSGDRFGRWTVTGPAEVRARYQKYFPCRCECGREKAVWQNDLLHGGSLGCKSCQIRHRNLKYGPPSLPRPFKTPEYGIWTHIIGRCEDPNDPAFHYYGGRGIRMCARWREDFRNFLADMGPRPSPEHSIDRINNNGPYDVANCRWATRIEQANNKRNNVFVAAHGERMTVPNWARRIGVAPGTIHARLRAGWDPERAVSVRK